MVKGMSYIAPSKSQVKRAKEVVDALPEWSCLQVLRTMFIPTFYRYPPTDVGLRELDPIIAEVTTESAALAKGWLYTFVANKGVAGTLRTSHELFEKRIEQWSSAFAASKVSEFQHMSRTGLPKVRVQELILLQYSFNVQGYNLVFYCPTPDLVTYDILLSEVVKREMATGVPIELWSSETQKAVEESEMRIIASVSETWKLQEDHPDFRRHLELNFMPGEEGEMQDIVPSLFSQLLKLPLSSTQSIVDMFVVSGPEASSASIRAERGGEVTITDESGEFLSLSEYMMRRSMSANESGDDTDGGNVEDTDGGEVDIDVAINLDEMD